MGRPTARPQGWQFKDLFAGLYRDDPTFKYEAASYLLNAATGRNLVAGQELQGDGSAQAQARWAAARRKWAEWWTANRQTFQLANPYR